MASSRGEIVFGYYKKDSFATCNMRSSFKIACQSLCCRRGTQNPQICYRPRWPSDPCQSVSIMSRCLYLSWWESLFAQLCQQGPFGEQLTAFLARSGCASLCAWSWSCSGSTPTDSTPGTFPSSKAAGLCAGTLWHSCCAPLSGSRSSTCFWRSACGPCEGTWWSSSRRGSEGSLSLTPASSSSSVLACLPRAYQIVWARTQTGLNGGFFAWKKACLQS